MIAFFLTHFWDFFFTPKGQAWYTGNVWGNVVAIVPCGILAFLWAKSRFWPLNLIHAKLDQAMEHHKHAQMMIEEIHHKMHTGKDHPRVTARKEQGLHPTPNKPESKE